MKKSLVVVLTVAVLALTFTVPTLAAAPNCGIVLSNCKTLPTMIQVQCNPKASANCAGLFQNLSSNNCFQGLNSLLNQLKNCR
ncbi:MAG TPA: hypothetical protein PL158_06395 [Bacillota bacterium]|nr:hypothetical protein [Bacillota bacterium]HOL09754.1 hypothetical protein [Bacillota bacterium]HOL09755.1 hypothetical protein [Bacillota bacterium]